MWTIAWRIKMRNKIWFIARIYNQKCFCLSNHQINNSFFYIILPKNFLCLYLGQNPGGFMDDRPKISDFSVGKVSGRREFKSVERKTFGCLTKRQINVLQIKFIISIQQTSPKKHEFIHIQDFNIQGSSTSSNG